jgi:hypothetical protein
VTLSEPWWARKLRRWRFGGLLPRKIEAVDIVSEILISERNKPSIKL